MSTIFILQKFEDRKIAVFGIGVNANTGEPKNLLRKFGSMKNIKKMIHVS